MTHFCLPSLFLIFACKKFCEQKICLQKGLPTKVGRPFLYVSSPHLYPQKGDQVDGLFGGDDSAPQVLDSKA